MDCRGCGKCCILSHPYLDVKVVKDDETPGELTEYREWFGDAAEVGFWMRRKKNGECIAFDSAKRECKIYSVRPEECRAFTQAHPLCKELCQ